MEAKALFAIGFVLYFVFCGAPIGVVKAFGTPEETTGTRGDARERLKTAQGQAEIPRARV
jgi:hypothetical protein